MQTKHTRHLSPLSLAASRLPALLLLSTLLLSWLLPGVATAEIRQPVAQLSLWNRGECTRINDSSFSVPDTARNVAIYRPGVPMRYGDTIGTWRYGLITSVADAGATLTVTMADAARMETTFDGFCEYGSETLLRFETYVVPGTFADDTDTDLFLHDLKMIATPHKGTTRYLLRMCARSISDDTGVAQPDVWTIVDGIPTTNNIDVVDNAWTCSGASIHEEYYDLRNGQIWRIGVLAEGTNDDSTDLTVQLVWLQEE
jgi:hypothetical protein